MDVDLIMKVIAAMNDSRVQYVIFGGAALNILGLARFTEDLDVFVEPTAENIERLKTALRSVFDDPHIDEITSADLLGDYPAVQYVPPTGSFHIDILTRLGEAFAYHDLQWQTLDFGGVPARVVTPRTLYRMKKDTVRLKDRADAEAIKKRFGIEDD